MSDLARAYHLGNQPASFGIIEIRDIFGQLRCEPELCLGMTKRETFAGKAMEGLLARNYPSIQETAKEAVKMADLLLLELTENRTL